MVSRALLGHLEAWSDASGCNKVRRPADLELGFAFLTYSIVEVIDVLVMFELLKLGFCMESIGLW